MNLQVLSCYLMLVFCKNSLVAKMIRNGTNSGSLANEALVGESLHQTLARHLTLS